MPINVTRGIHNINMLFFENGSNKLRNKPRNKPQNKWPGTAKSGAPFLGASLPQTGHSPDQNKNFQIGIIILQTIVVLSAIVIAIFAALAWFVGKLASYKPPAQSQRSLV